MKKENDITGKKINKWTVLEFHETTKRFLKWRCRCECGTIKIVSGQNLKNSSSKSCGCLRSESAKKKKINLLGMKFNRLTVIEEELNKKYTDAVWICLCDCGNKSTVKASKLKNGKTKSCGCWNRDRIVKAGIEWSRSDLGKKLRSVTNSSKRGHESPNWKGGREEENIRLRTSPEAKRWRQCVYERDGFICQMCKEQGKRLNAHHKKSWSLFPSLRYDVDNGLTVCKECHKKIHKIHGNPKRKKCLH